MNKEDLRFNSISAWIPIFVGFVFLVVSFIGDHTSIYIIGGTLLIIIGLLKLSILENDT